MCIHEPSKTNPLPLKQSNTAGGDPYSISKYHGLPTKYEPPPTGIWAVHKLRSQARGRGLPNVYDTT